MPVRRSANPLIVQHVWDSIRSINAQRQMADFNRIVKYLQRVLRCTQTEAELYHKQTLDDGLIELVHKTPVKGPNAGTVVKSYIIPVHNTNILENNEKDWYCIDCHLAGEVIECRTCYRVYHKECSSKKRFSFKKLKEKRFLSSFTAPTKNLVHISDVNKSRISNENENKENSNLQQSFDKLEQELERMQGSSDLTNSINILNENELSPKIDPLTVLLSEDEENNEYDETLCSVCNLCQLESECNLEEKELNYLLTFVHNRIKTWLPLSIIDKMSAEERPEWFTESENAWRAKHLFFKPMNMPYMAVKLQIPEYKKLSEFQADVLTIQHNVGIYHGSTSQEYAASKYMIDDCRYDLDELVNCSDCYKHSNEKSSNKWFCLPCKNPHELVWAKQKGYPYWPAKVMRKIEDTYDVRFFGGKYERAVIPKASVKPITTNARALQIKKSSAFNKAMSELHLHQKFLKNPTEIEKINSPEKKKPRARNSTSKIPEININVENIAEQNIKIDLEEKDPLEIKTKPKRSLKRKKSTNDTPVEVKLTRSKVSIIENAIKTKSEEETINLSDMEVQEEVVIEGPCYGFETIEANYEEVSSSTEQLHRADEPYHQDNSDGMMPETERQYSESVEQARRKLEQCLDKSQLVNVAIECMQEAIDKLNSDHDEYVKKLLETHNSQISETKKKQWCFNCEQEAIYHCCWNTAYCSPSCQQQHWQTEHKKNAA